MIFKKYLKDPLSTIAVNTTIFIAGYPFFGILATIGVVSEFVGDYKKSSKKLKATTHSTTFRWAGKIWMHIIVINSEWCSCNVNIQISNY